MWCMRVGYVTRRLANAEHNYHFFQYDVFCFLKFLALCQLFYTHTCIKYRSELLS